MDPLTKEYPWYTPYQFAGNKPTRFIDLDGLEEYDPMQDEFFVARLATTTFFDLKHAVYNVFLTIIASDTRARYKRDESGDEIFETEFVTIEPELSLEGFGKGLLHVGLDVATLAGGAKMDATDVLGARHGSYTQIIRAIRNFSDPSRVIKKFTREGDLGGTINLSEGTSKKGFKHILERHSADEFLDNATGKGDLFPSGTTDDQIFNAIEEVFAKGTRVSDAKKSVQTFEKRIKVNNESGNYRLIVDNESKEVVSFFKIGGTE